ncbi:MAG: glycosyltransferase family 2 protein, partial [Deefgea sp.]
MNSFKVIMKLSVIIPFFNPNPIHFAEMLYGLRDANCTDFAQVEVILVNDGGIDARHDEIATFTNACPQFAIQLISLPENQGVSCARNAGLAAATGDWIAFHDADDISLPQRFVQSAKFLQAHPAVIAVSGDMQVFDEANPLVSVRLFPISDAEICVDNLFYCAMAQPALMINRQLWQASGVQFTPKMDMAQDWDFLIRLSQHGQLANLGVPLVRYRQHQHQRSSGIQREHANQHVRKIWQDQLQHLGSRVTPELLQTHGLLSPYWLWKMTDLDGAWALSGTEVQHWRDTLITNNQISAYVDHDLLLQRINHIERHWRAWQASGKQVIELNQL